MRCTCIVLGGMHVPHTCIHSWVSAYAAVKLNRLFFQMSEAWSRFFNKGELSGTGRGQHTAEFSMTVKQSGS